MEMSKVLSDWSRKNKQDYYQNCDSAIIRFYPFFFVQQ